MFTFSFEWHLCCNRLFRNLWPYEAQQHNDGAIFKLGWAPRFRDSVSPCLSARTSECEITNKVWQSLSEFYQFCGWAGDNRGRCREGITITGEGVTRGAGSSYNRRPRRERTRLGWQSSWKKKRPGVVCMPACAQRNPLYTWPMILRGQGEKCWPNAQSRFPSSQGWYQVSMRWDLVGWGVMR